MKTNYWLDKRCAGFYMDFITMKLTVKNATLCSQTLDKKQNEADLCNWNDFSDSLVRCWQKVNIGRVKVGIRCRILGHCDVDGNDQSDDACREHGFLQYDKSGNAEAQIGEIAPPLGVN